MFCLKRGVKPLKENRLPLPASSSIGSLDDLLTDGNASFLRAARAGNIEKVLEYLKGNIDINTSNANGLNALHLASKEGHVGVVTELLKRGANVNAATKKGNTALHIASLAGQDEVVRVLVHLGANVNVQSQNGFTPLYMAAQENHDGVVSFLLASGANQSLATEDGFTPLAVALQQGHDKVVAVLLENDTKGRVRLPALHIAAKKDDCKAAALLLQNDHNPDVTSKSGFTPLHIAAHYGNENIANLLLEKGADVNYAAKHQITPLHVASKWGKANMVTLLTDKGARIESSTRDGLTPLHCAARSGHDQVVDLLLNKGAPMLAKTKNGLAPLHMASQGDHVDSAHILLGHNAPVDDVTVDYLTALHVAAHCGHVKVAKLLLDSKADPNARALNGFTPLHIACKKNRIKVVELLLKYGASIEATTESGLTPLHVASFMGCMNIVIYLIQNGANPDVPTVRGETPLHLAARANQTDIIRILLRNGANVDARAREEQTPLHIAARLGNVDIVSLLLQHGAAVDATTKDMYTALHIAAKEDQEEVASVLLDHGASLTATTKKGFTPLHLAAKYGNIKVARLLLQKDAPVDAQGKNGVTPLHVAAHYDNVNVALLLLDKGASPHAMAKNGYTPLHIAAKKNQMDIATTLLEYGAKANSESKAGFTPLHLASQEGHTDMTTLLIEHQGDVNFAANNGLTPLHLCAQDDRVNVAAILVKNGAKIGPQTKAGYTPLHVASHFGQINMVRFLLQQSADVHMTTSHGYTPLHQAAQQGHTHIVNLLLENEASPNVTTSQGQTALSIAQRLGYISVVETLKVVTETTVTTTTTTVTEEKYKVVAPETMQETFMTDSEDEGGGDFEDAALFGKPTHATHVYLPYIEGQKLLMREDTMLGDQSYRYLTADEMKSLGDDSLPIDVTKDEKHESMILSKESPAPMVEEDNISPQHITPVEIGFSEKYSPDNVDISHAPVHAGSFSWDDDYYFPIPSKGMLRSSRLKWKTFLVSFMVDARGGAMRGCRHSGVRVIIPPRKAPMPMRITCRYLRKEKLIHPPPLMEGEACASRILEVGPVGARFLGPVIIEVPHFASLRGKEREITILRSDNGDSWREHTLEASEEAVQEVLNESFEGEELSALEDLNTSRITRILTTDFPQYFAIITRIRQEVHAVGPEGGMVSSTVVPQVQAIFSEGALTKKIRVGLQAQPISPELVAKLLGNRVAVSPIVTVEPRRRKFHKPITLTIPVPQAATKGMINQYSGDAPTLRLLCSITGGSSKAQWEDVTGSTPLTLVNDCVSFTTTVSARFWLMDCRVNEATKFATELYQEAVHVPFMAKFVVFAKRHDPNEAQMRVFCMTDDKEDKTLETQEHFTEIAKSRDVEVLENKLQYLEFAGNLVPVTKSGEQLKLTFQAFRENRLPFTIRVKDPHVEPLGRIAFMKEPKVGRGEPPQTPICNLNVSMPEVYMSESTPIVSELVTLEKRYDFIQEAGLSKPESIHRADLRLSDIARELDKDWVALAQQLDVSETDINIAKSEYPEDISEQALTMLRFWLQKSGSRATGNELEKGLRKINREDIIKKCMFNVELVTDVVEKAVAKVHLDQSGFDIFKEELGSSREASMRRGASLDASYDEQDIMKEAESAAETSSETGSLFERDQISQALSEDKENIPQLYEDIVVNSAPYIQDNISPVILENSISNKQKPNHESILSNGDKMIAENQDVVIKTSKENGLQETLHEKTNLDYYDLKKVDNNNIKNVCDFTDLPEQFTTYKSKDITVIKDTELDTCDGQENGDYTQLQGEKAVPELEVNLISNKNVCAKNILYGQEESELLPTDNFKKDVDSDVHKIGTSSDDFKPTEFVFDKSLVLDSQENEPKNIDSEQKEKHNEHLTFFAPSEIVDYTYDDLYAQSDSVFKTVLSDFHEKPNTVVEEPHAIYEHKESSGMSETKTDLKSGEVIFEETNYLSELSNVKELEKEREIPACNETNMLGETPLVVETSQIFEIQSEVAPDFAEPQRASEDIGKKMIHDSYKIEEMQQDVENRQNMNLIRDISQTSSEELEPSHLIEEEIAAVLELERPPESDKVTCTFEEISEVDKKTKELEISEVIDSLIVDAYFPESHMDSVSEEPYLEQSLTENFNKMDASNSPEVLGSTISSGTESSNMYLYTESAKVIEKSSDMPSDILKVASFDQPIELENEEGNDEIPFFTVTTDSTFQTDTLQLTQQNKGAEDSPFSEESADQYNLSSPEILEETETFDYEIIQDDTSVRLLKASESERETGDTLIDELLYKKGEIINIDQYSIKDENSYMQDLVSKDSVGQVLNIGNIVEHASCAKDIQIAHLESEYPLSSKDDNRMTESCEFSAVPYTLNETEAKICKVSRTPPPSPAEIIDKVLLEKQTEEIEKPITEQITVETQEVVGDNAVVKQVTTTIIKTSEVTVPAEVEVAPLEIQELTPKLTESETWPSGEMDTSQVSVSSLPDDEKSEPTTATVSSATTAEADVDTKVQEETKEWTEMDASGTTRHVIQKTTHMNLVMKQKSDDTSEEEAISRSSVPELSTAASESQVLMETAYDEKQDLEEIAVGDIQKEWEILIQDETELEGTTELKQDDTKKPQEKEECISHSPLLDEHLIKEDYKDIEQDVEAIEKKILTEDIQQDIELESNVEEMESFKTTHSKMFEERVDESDEIQLKPEPEAKTEECRSDFLEQSKHVDFAEELGQQIEEMKDESISEVIHDQFIESTTAVEEMEIQVGISDSEEVAAPKEEYDISLCEDVPKITPFSDELKGEKVIVQAECEEIIEGTTYKTVEAESVQEISQPFQIEEKYEIMLNALEETKTLDKPQDYAASKDDEGKTLGTEPERKSFETMMVESDVIIGSSEEITELLKDKGSFDMLLPSEKPEDHTIVKDIEQETLYVDHKSVKDEASIPLDIAMRMQDLGSFEKLPDDEAILSSSEILSSLQMNEMHEVESPLEHDTKFEDFKQESVDVSSEKITETTDMIEELIGKEEPNDIQYEEDYQSSSVQKAVISEVMPTSQMSDQGGFNFDEQQVESEQKCIVAEMAASEYVTESKQHFVAPVEIVKDVKHYEFIEHLEEKSKTPEVPADMIPISKDIDDELEEFAILKEETPIIPSDVKESIVDVSEDSVAVLTPELLETETDIVMLDAPIPVKPDESSLEQEPTNIFYTYPLDDFDTEASYLIDTSTEEVESGEQHPVDLKQFSSMQQVTQKEHAQPEQLKAASEATDTEDQFSPTSPKEPTSAEPVLEKVISLPVSLKSELHDLETQIKPARKDITPVVVPLSPKEYTSTEHGSETETPLHMVLEPEICDPETATKHREKMISLVSDEEVSGKSSDDVHPISEITFESAFTTDTGIVISGASSSTPVITYSSITTLNDSAAESPIVHDVVVSDAKIVPLGFDNTAFVGAELIDASETTVESRSRSPYEVVREVTETHVHILEQEEIPKSDFLAWDTETDRPVTEAVEIQEENDIVHFEKFEDLSDNETALQGDDITLSSVKPFITHSEKSLEGELCSRPSEECTESHLHGEEEKSHLEVEAEQILESKEPVSLSLFPTREEVTICAREIIEEIKSEVQRRPILQHIPSEISDEDLVEREQSPRESDTEHDIQTPELRKQTYFDIQTEESIASTSDMTTLLLQDKHIISLPPKEHAVQMQIDKSEEVKDMSISNFQKPLEMEYSDESEKLTKNSGLEFHKEYKLDEFEKEVLIMETHDKTEVKLLPSKDVEILSETITELDSKLVASGEVSEYPFSSDSDVQLTKIDSKTVTSTVITETTAQTYPTTGQGSFEPIYSSDTDHAADLTEKPYEILTEESFEKEIVEQHISIVKGDAQVISFQKDETGLDVTISETEIQKCEVDGVEQQKPPSPELDIVMRTSPFEVITEVDLLDYETKSADMQPHTSPDTDQKKYSSDTFLLEHQSQSLAETVPAVDIQSVFTKDIATIGLEEQLSVSESFSTDTDRTIHSFDNVVHISHHITSPQIHSETDTLESSKDELFTTTTEHHVTDLNVDSKYAEKETSYSQANGPVQVDYTPEYDDICYEEEIPYSSTADQELDSSRIPFVSKSSSFEIDHAEYEPRTIMDSDVADCEIKTVCKQSELTDAVHSDYNIPKIEDSGVSSIVKPEEFLGAVGGLQERVYSDEKEEILHQITRDDEQVEISDTPFQDLEPEKLQYYGSVSDDTVDAEIGKILSLEAQLEEEEDLIERPQTPEPSEEVQLLEESTALTESKETGAAMPDMDFIRVTSLKQERKIEGIPDPDMPFEFTSSEVHIEKALEAKQSSSHKYDYAQHAVEGFEVIDESELQESVTEEKYEIISKTEIEEACGKSMSKTITTDISISTSDKISKVVQDQDANYSTIVFPSTCITDENSSYTYGMQFEREIEEQPEEAMDIESDQYTEEKDETDASEKEPIYSYGMRFERDHEIDDEDIPGYGDLYTHQEEDEDAFDDAEKVRALNLSLTAVDYNKQNPDYDTLAGRKFFSKSGEHDDISMSSLQEFERLEEEIGLVRKSSVGSVDSFNGKQFHSKSGEHDDISMNSLTEFEKLERECSEAERVEATTKEVATRLSEIEEGHESQASEASQETLSDTGREAESNDSDDFDQRLNEIDQIIKQAQTNVEQFQEDEPEVKADILSQKLHQKIAVLSDESTSNACKDILPERDGDHTETPTEYTVGEMKEMEVFSVDSCIPVAETKLVTTVIKQVYHSASPAAESVSQIPESFDQHISTGIQRNENDVDQDSLHEDQSMKQDSLSGDEKLEYQDSLHEEKSGDIDSLQDDARDEMRDSLCEERALDEDSLHEMDILPDESSLSLESSLAAVGDVSHDSSKAEYSEKIDVVHSHVDQDIDADSLKELTMGATLETVFSSQGIVDLGVVDVGKGDIMVSSTDSLEPSSSAATHATYQFETESVMSSSINSVQTSDDYTMISSTDTLDPDMRITYMYGDTSMSDLQILTKDGQQKVFLDSEGNIQTHQNMKIFTDSEGNIQKTVISSSKDMDEMSNKATSLPMEVRTCTTTTTYNKGQPLTKPYSVPIPFDQFETEKEYNTTESATFTEETFSDQTDPNVEIEEIRTVDEKGNPKFIRRIKRIVKSESQTYTSASSPEDMEEKLKDFLRKHAAGGDGGKGEEEMKEERTIDEKGNVIIVHTVKRQMLSEPEVHSKSFTGPDAETQSKEYVKTFQKLKSSDDIDQFESTDADGNIVRITQQVVIKPEVHTMSFSGPDAYKQMEEYMKQWTASDVSGTEESNQASTHSASYHMSSSSHQHPYFSPDPSSFSTSSLISATYADASFGSPAMSEDTQQFQDVVENVSSDPECTSTTTIMTTTRVISFPPEQYIQLSENAGLTSESATEQSIEDIHDHLRLKEESCHPPHSESH